MHRIRFFHWNGSNRKWRTRSFIHLSIYSFIHIPRAGGHYPSHNGPWLEALISNKWWSPRLGANDYSPPTRINEWNKWWIDGWISRWMAEKELFCRNLPVRPCQIPTLPTFLSWNFRGQKKGFHNVNTCVWIQLYLFWNIK